MPRTVLDDTEFECCVKIGTRARRLVIINSDCKARTAAFAEARRQRERQAYLAELSAIHLREHEFEEVAAELDALVR